MTPLDFIRGGDQYNDPLGKHKESLDKVIKLFAGPDEEFEILSYYMAKDGRMCLDIQRKEN